MSDRSFSDPSCSADGTGPRTGRFHLLPIPTLPPALTPDEGVRTGSADAQVGTATPNQTVSSAAAEEPVASGSAGYPVAAAPTQQTVGPGPTD